MERTCVVVLLAAFVLMAMSPEGAMGQGWLQYQKDAQNTGVSTGDISSESWSYSTESGVISPVVRDNGSAYFKSTNGFYSINTSTRETNWIRSASGTGIASPVVDENTVYFPDSNGTVHAYNATGGLKWRYNTTNKAFSTPAISGERLYFPDLGNVHAVDTNTGEAVWKKEVGGEVAFSPSLNHSVYVGTIQGMEDGPQEPEGHLYSLGKEDGKVNWKINVSGVATTPAVDQKRVYFGTADGWMHAVNRTNGEMVWSTETGTASISSPAIYGKSMYYGDISGSFYSLNASDGSTRWVLNATGEMVLSPAVSSDTVYVGNRGGDIYSLGTDNGNVIWNASINEGVSSLALTAAGTTVYIGGNSGVYAVSDGEVVPTDRQGDSNDTGVDEGNNTTSNFSGQKADQEGTLYILYPLFVGIFMLGVLALYGWLDYGE
jgi:outer membrane protein assembly factor BamB